MKSDRKGNLAHSVFQRLFNKAKQNNEDFNLLLTRYGIERFLYRLSISDYKDSFILKGASLFLVWKGQNYRVTKDADLLGVGDLTPPKLSDMFKAICVINCTASDGVIYLPDSVKTQEIREDNVYGGVRITLLGMLYNARISLQIDIGFGDSVLPIPEIVEYPTILDLPHPKMRAYTMYTLIAEKLETMVQLGMANSRIKDFYDIWLLSKIYKFEGKILSLAIKNTFKCRRTLLPETLPFAFTSSFYEDTDKQKQWKAFIRKSKPELSVDDIASVISEISKFIMPVIIELKKDKFLEYVWQPEQGWLSTH
ncbi:MAG: nucleotidyl transferase AbiEii/AbiGii toxin family protein [Lentisphaerota bacterium]